MEACVIFLLCAVIVGCAAAGLPLLVPLLVGEAILWTYGVSRGLGAGALLRLSVSGVRQALGVLESFVLIGALTALWRADGTIALLASAAARVVTPATAPLAAFLLTSLVSYLMGTSFGTAATMGVACATMARSLGADPALVGGAVLSGCYFGDRCSPVSSSALLVRTVTQTDLRGNLSAMARSAAVPLALSVAGYLALGAMSAGASAGAGLEGASEMARLLTGEFGQGVWALLPALVILALPLLGAGMKVSMAASLAAAALVCLLWRGLPASEVLLASLTGFQATDPQVAALMDGGGVLSMANVSAVVLVSATYEGLLEGTGLLDGLRCRVEALCRRVGPSATVLAVGVPASMIACNQTLAIMLTNELCRPLEPDGRARALDLENGPVVISPLVPWSVAGSTILSMAGSPVGGFGFTFYLWLIPLCHLAGSLLGREDNFARAKTFLRKVLANLGALPYSNFSR